jgi:hypothetical protein
VCALDESGTIGDAGFEYVVTPVGLIRYASSVEPAKISLSAPANRAHNVTPNPRLFPFGVSLSQLKTITLALTSAENVDIRQGASSRFINLMFSDNPREPRKPNLSAFFRDCQTSRGANDG